MKLSDIPANKFPIPFANAAGPSYITTIPEASQIGITAGAASLTDGFVPLNFDPVGSGGVPPRGVDFNGLLKQITQWSQWQNAGGLVPYDGTFSTAIGGYPKGAVLSSASTAGLIFVSKIDDNTNNPDSVSTGWERLALVSAVQSGSYNYASASGTNTYTVTLSPAPPSLSVGFPISIYFANANTTTSPTLNVNGLGAKNIFLRGGDAPAAGDISGWKNLIYDGTAFRMTGIAASEIVSGSNVVASLGIQRFTSNGTFTVPAGVTKVRVTVIGAGGGGGGNDGTTQGASGGGGGSAAIGRVSVTPGQTIAVTIGTQGAGGSGGGGTGGTGGTSSFGAYMSAPGGPGGLANGNVNGQAIIATGGDINFNGLTPQVGGTTLFGGPGAHAILGYGSGGNAGSGVQAGAGYGSGGSGAGPSTSLGGAQGAPGIVIVEW